MIPDINLLPKVEKESSDSKLIYILLAIVAILACTYFAWEFFSARSETIVLENEEANLITERDQLQTELSTLESLQEGSIEESVAFVETVSYPVSPLIDETQRLLSNNAYLRNYTFNTETVDISVDFETLNDVSRYITRLTRSPYFIDVQISSIENTEIGNAEQDEANFQVVPRQAASITLTINKQHLATGGGR